MLGTDPPLSTLQTLVASFCAARDWDRFHNAKDLAIGVVTEASELLDLFRFRSETESDALLADPTRRRRVEDELADVLFFVLRFAQRYGIDLAAAFEAKMAVNADRYPVDKARGRNVKYTDL
jgi:NTP pyrophosphatase (non-canonical NTP hydrolase)